MKKIKQQRPVRGIWEWLMTGDWEGGDGTTGGRG